MTRTVIVVTDQRLSPPWGGNRLRILGLIAGLRSLRWNVILVTLRSHAAPELHKFASRVVYIKGPAFLGGDIASFSVDSFRRVVEELTRTFRPSMVIAEYAWMAPVLQFLPTAVVRYVDCHDFLSERTRRFQTAGLDPWVICSEQQEHELLSHADVLIAIQHREQQALQRLLPKREVVCLLPAIELTSAFHFTLANSSTVLAVGSNHAGNDGIREFVETHWPQVIRKLPEAKLCVIGRIGEVLNDAPGVNVIGPVKDLTTYYRTAAVVLCPVTVGTGIKIKMLEALRYGKAVIATPVAVEGLPPSNTRAWVTENTLSVCANSIVELLTNNESRARLERAAFAYGEQYLSRNSFLNQLQSILPGRARQLFAELAPSAWLRNGYAGERAVCK